MKITEEVPVELRVTRAKDGVLNVDVNTTKEVGAVRIFLDGGALYAGNPAERAADSRAFVKHLDALLSQAKSEAQVDEQKANSDLRSKLSKMMVEYGYAYLAEEAK